MDPLRDGVCPICDGPTIRYGYTDVRAYWWASPPAFPDCISREVLFNPTYYEVCRRDCYILSRDRDDCIVKIGRHGVYNYRWDWSLSIRNKPIVAIDHPNLTITSAVAALRHERLTDQSGRRPFEDDIVKDRYDQTTRLIYADWLEDRGFDDVAAAQRSWTKERQEAEDWLRDFAAKSSLEYGEVIHAASRYQTHGDICNLRERTEEAQGMVFADRESFWQNYETLTGDIVEPFKKGQPFSCSC